jgi:hypothetical protein
MATDPLARAVEVFSSPIEGVIAALGAGIAEAQIALDRNSIQTQAEIDADPVLSQLGTQATWYQLPRVDLELKIAMTMSEERNSGTGLAPSALLKQRAVKLIAQPVSASYQNHFNFSAQGSTVVKLSIVPVPAPRPGDQVTATPALSRDDVEQAALKSPAKFATTQDSQGRTIPDPKLRFDVNFNGLARLWYVLQYDPADPAKAVVVSVDDATRAVRVIGA